MDGFGVSNLKINGRDIDRQRLLRAFGSQDGPSATRVSQMILPSVLAPCIAQPDNGGAMAVQPHDSTRLAQKFVLTPEEVSVPLEN